MAEFSWSSAFTVGHPIPYPGDKIILPQRALESLIQAHTDAPPPRTASLQELSSYDPTSWEPSPFDQRQPPKPRELPSPLTFQIRNPANRTVTHGGVREFSANDNTVHLPAWMMASLNLAVSDQVMVKFQDLPKGTWAKFRPLTMDYIEIVDFRAAFEAFLRSHYNTLTAGEVLTIEQAKRSYQFVVEELKPANAVCITDTDLEVDIEPLDTDLKDRNDIKHMSEVRIAKEMKDQVLKIGVESSGTVSNDNYQRWKIDVPIRTSGIQITVNVQEPGDLDVLISTKSPVTVQDHIWSNFESVGPRIVVIPATDQDYAAQQDSQSLHIGIFGRASLLPSGSSSLHGDVDYSVLVQYHDDPSTAAPSSGSMSSAQPNENCDKCGQVMKKEDAVNHFHCNHCDKHGDISEKNKHMEIYHGWYQCSCGSFESARLPDLALHRRTDCSERFIICRYCHTLVQQGALSSNARDRIRGLHAHESYCGDRTIQCQKCTQMVSLKDVQVHAKNHEYQRQNQSTPKLCTNQNCVRNRSTNILGLCQLCFGPYWVPTEDPKHQKLAQRLARKYHSQLMAGCGNSWCRNSYCATSRGREMDATSAATELMVILKEAKIGSTTETGKVWLCVDEATTRKKVLAQVLFEDLQGQYAIEWCVKALESEMTDLDAAVQWLNQQAPRLSKAK
ncbi:MAG: ubiquitin fusion degradation protein UFD1-domain-containing protein [Podila humilis]|nr:MAG: ubiquitin fusion degradation protein UFD1-domain-containing protein [Podila humilis]